MSPGSAISAYENLMKECLQRLDGLFVEQDSGELIYFDFGDGRGRCLVPGDYARPLHFMEIDWVTEY